jgi:hypothetical protein
MKARNKLVDERSEYGPDFIYNPDVLRGASTERKMIWQYIFSNAGLPLHIRRTLDQFGNPNLENTEERDCDQVVFKWARDASGKVKELLGIPTSGEDSCKVLMVDQLWCWIINKGKFMSRFSIPQQYFDERRFI